MDLMSKQRSVQQEFYVSLWFIALAIGLAALIAALYQESTAIVPRTIILCFVLGFWAFLLYSWAGWRISDVVELNPNSIVIVASGVAGLATWLIAWWFMSMVQDYILNINDYMPPAIYRVENLEEVWFWLVLSDVVLLPLLMLLLMWGVLSAQLQQLSPWLFALLAGYLFGMFGMAVFGQGLSGFVGYGLAGFVGGYLSALAKHGWAGVIVQGVFLYANMLLLDDLARAVGNADYFEMAWITRVVISFFVLIVAVQVVRALREPSTSKATALPMSIKALLSPLLTLAAIMAVVILVRGA